jgi:HD superfamily phosphohydrolase
MKLRGNKIANAYQGKALIADPIYQYIWFTVPASDFPSEKTERDLIDSPWLQRLRRIHQLQSARWVYPAAEHTRFQHSLGTMHMAGEFGRYLYPSIAEVAPDIPSINFVEELLRLAGLLHDVGHGPYGHFFDDNFLDQYDLTHEILGQKIITRNLGRIIGKIRRSPTGNFEKGESIDPRQISFLIKKPGEKEALQPKWLHLLRQLFSGIYTVDNLDYVQRDAFMTGFSIDIIDIKRLCFYTFYTKEGFTLHQAGTSALTRFLNARLNLYSNVYFHRTTRALDLHLQEIFRDTMNIILPSNPLDNLDEYLDCDEWSLMQGVKGWLKEKDPIKKRLAREWNKLHLRQVKWKMSFAAELFVDQIQKGARFSGVKDYEKQIRAHLSKTSRGIRFRVDLATQDPRPINPMTEGNKRINIFNPSTETTSPEPLRDIYRFIPARVVHFRVFSLNHEHDEELAMAAEKALGSIGEVVKTNI